jgi:hypothetical protein
VIRARLDGDTTVAPFKYFDKGTMATIGRTHAVARLGGMSFTGIIAYLMWAFIHVLYLIGWGKRFGTLYSWGRSLWFTKNRAHRTITLDQAIERSGTVGGAAPSRKGGAYIEAVATASAVRRHVPPGWPARSWSTGACPSCLPLSSRDSPPQASARAGETWRDRSADLSAEPLLRRALSVGEHRHGDAMISDFQFTRRHGDGASANCAEVMPELLWRHDCVSGELRESLREQTVRDRVGENANSTLPRAVACAVASQRVETRHRIVRSLLDVSDLVA